MDEAWLHFGKPKLKQLFNAPPPQFQAPKVNPNNWGTALLDALAAPQRHNTAVAEHARLRAEACAEMRANICARLHDAALLAYAHQVAPTQVRTYRRIQPDFWKRPDVVWEKDIANDAARTYQRIVIIDPARFPELQARPRVGGHTERDKIYGALNVIAAMDDFRGKRPHIQRQRVRKELKLQNRELDVEGDYFHDDTLQRHINRYLEDNPNNENNKSK